MPYLVRRSCDVTIICQAVKKGKAMVKTGNDSAMSDKNSLEANLMNEWNNRILKYLKDHVKLLVQERVNLQTEIYKLNVDALKAEILELKFSQEFICDKYDQLKKNIMNSKKKKKIENRQVILKKRRQMKI